MAGIQDLSNELVLGILEEVLPEDIVSISLASKSIYQLAIPRLEKHRSLQERYTYFQNTDEYGPFVPQDPCGLLADLLCNIMTDPEIGHYLEEIDLKSWNNGATDGWEPDAVFERQLASEKQLQQESKTNMEIMEEAVRAAGVIPTEEVDDWVYQIRCGNEDPLVALILLYAPKLHNLRLELPSARSESSYLLKTIQRIARQGCTAKFYPSQLKDVVLSFDEEWRSLDIVKAFMSLPSLESIKTDDLFVFDDPNPAIIPQPSDLKDISFRSGSVTGKALSKLLRGVKNLRRFGYDFQQLWRAGRYPPTFHCSDVLCSLEANASHTLTYLKLGADDIKTSQIAPLRRFRVLREIEIRTSRCFAVDDGKPANLIGLLPVSLKSFTMRWHVTTSVKGVVTLTEAILSLVRESKTQLPLLRKLHVRTMDRRAFFALWYCLASDITAQINPMLSFKIQGPDDDRREIGAWASNVCTCGQDCFGNGAK